MRDELYFEDDLNIFGKIEGNRLNEATGYSPNDIKRLLDESGLTIQEYINSKLVPGLSAENIEFDYAGWDATNVLDAILAAAESGGGGGGGGELLPNAVKTVHLNHVEGQEAVDTGAIRDEAVTTDKIAPLAIETDLLADDAVTEEKLGADAVTRNKIKDGEVIAGKLGSSAVDTDNIKNGAVIATKIPDGALTAAKFAAGQGFQKETIKLEAILGFNSLTNTYRLYLPSISKTVIESASVLCTYHPDSYTTWIEKGVRCYAQGWDSSYDSGTGIQKGSYLDFMCTEKFTGNVKANLLFIP